MNIYVNSIVSAVTTIISSWDACVNSGWSVCELDEYNTNPNRTPWVGIYSPTISFEPRRANIIQPFMAIVNIPVITQASNFGQDHKQAIRDLEDLTGEVYTAVSCYRSLLNTVNIVTGIDWNPFGRVVEETDNLVANQLNIIAEVFA